MMWSRVLLNLFDKDRLDTLCAHAHHVGAANNVNSIYGKLLGSLGGESTSWSHEAIVSQGRHQHNLHLINFNRFGIASPDNWYRV